MSRMPEQVESNRIMVSAQSMIDEAREGLVQLQHAWESLGVDGPRIASAYDAAMARGAPAWMASAQHTATATAPAVALTPIQFHDTRRARKHRFMV